MPAREVSGRLHLMLPSLPLFIGAHAGSTLLPGLAIALSALLLEDLTTVIVGILAAEGYVSIGLALTSLYTGIILGDLALYTIGVIARTHPRLAHYIDHEYTASFRAWLESRYGFIIFTGHFIPGLRFTTYAASGFFRRPFSEFIVRAVAGGLVLGTTLFSLAYWFGSVTTRWMRPLRWCIALLFILILFFVSRETLKSYRRKVVTPGNADGTHES